MKYRASIFNKITGFTSLTKWYDSYQDAYNAAERLGKRNEIWDNVTVKVQEETDEWALIFKRMSYEK